MRLLVIGHYHKGKSTLLENLTGKPPESSFDRRAKRIRSDSQSRPLSLAGSP
jgi:translation elongation factor EF-1alpha